MKRTLLFLIGLLAPAIFLAQEVKVTQIVPMHCKSGEKCTVEIEIEKQGVEGFARIQQPLPEGFTATLLQDGGADFSFDKQKVSFIWLNLPASPVIRVAYQITVGPGVNGTVTLTDGVFSYIRETKIEKTPIPPVSMQVNMKIGTPVATPKEPVQEEPLVAVEEPQKKVIVEPVPDKLAPAEPEPQKPAEVAVKAPEVKAEPVAPQPVEEPKPKTEPVVHQPVAEPKAEPVAPQPVAESRPKAEPPATQPAAKPLEGTTVYRVQFSALKTYKEPTELKKQMGITDQVFCKSSADGWHRYSFGQWNRKEDAEAACREFNQRTGKSAFVVKQ